MAGEISQSHIRIANSPTAGLPGEHSPYYRKLISAGYKGYLQGTIGGATLYGVMGAAVGVLTGIGIFAATAGTAGLAAFAVVPFFAGYGVIKGASTFGSIGSNAAQLAEYAETNERRRALLDRLGETPSKEEATEIQKLLDQDGQEKGTTGMFHWKTLLVGAAIGAAIGAGLLVLAHALPLVAAEALHLGFLEGAVGLTKAAGLAIPVIGAIAGAATGSMIGLDRHYVRRWMDGAENLLHDQQHYEEISVVREHEASKLAKIAKKDEQAQRGNYPVKEDLKIPLPRGANSDAPSSSISNAQLQDRLEAALRELPAH